MSISTQAAVTVATSLGVPCDSPVVLHDGSNVVVHLRPSQVVARVATLTADVRPGISAWLARDIAVAQHLASRGVPATRPLSEPMVVDGEVAVLWHYEPHDPAHVFSPAEVAAQLASLHEALASFEDPLPRFAPCDERKRPLEVAVRNRAFSSASTGGRSMSGRVDGAAAVAAYPGAYSRDELAVCMELRDLVGVVWRFVLATRFPDLLGEAEENLRRWLAQHGDRHR